MPIDNVPQTEERRRARSCDEAEIEDEVEIENDFQKKCRKGAKFAARTAFSAMLGEISCLFSLALEFFTAFRCGRPIHRRASNFDIYLPKWLGSHNKTIFGTLFVINELIVLWCWLKRTRLSSANDGGTL